MRQNAQKQRTLTWRNHVANCVKSRHRNTSGVYGCRNQNESERATRDPCAGLPAGICYIPSLMLTLRIPARFEIVNVVLAISFVVYNR